MSRPLSWPSKDFLQGQDLWTPTCFCVTSSGAPQNVVAEEAGPKNLQD